MKQVSLRYHGDYDWMVTHFEQWLQERDNASSTVPGVAYYM